MKIAFLSRYQGAIQRGAETFVRELSQQLSTRHQVDILPSTDNLNSYDIVVAINGGWQALKASFGRFGRNYKLVISGQAGIGKDEIFNIVVAKPDLYVALTDTMYKWAKQWVWGSKIVKIPNGVDLNKFKPKGERFNFKLKGPVVLSVGALVWYKHHEKTIKAFSLLNAGSLVLVGDGPEKEKLESLGKKLLKDRFKIIHADYSDLPKIYQGADLFVLPSWDREAFGIVYLEAMATGLGIVAPQDASRREIIGEAGLLIDVSNPRQYAEAIDKALKINWETKSLKQASRFSWDNIALQYEKAFLDL